MGRKIAVVDVGSNSVRLMLLADGKILYKRTCITRLGEGLALSGVLSKEAIAHTVRQIQCFWGQAREDGAAEFYAYATAAVRSAKNGGEFVNAVKETTDVSLEVLSGEEEARIGLVGALGDADGALLDVGGASSELIIQKSKKIVYAKSLDVGVVRLYDLCGRDEKKLFDFCKAKVEGYDGAVNASHGLPLYAVGGTATTLAALSIGLSSYDGEKVTGTRLTREEIARLTKRLSSMTTDEIAALPCVDEKRAQVLTGGATWILHVVRYLGADLMTVSDSDNLDGFARTRGLL